MWKAAFRSLLERKLRLALTMVAILLGVAFVSGTYVLTDSIDRAFQEIFTRITAGFDVRVSPVQIAPQFGPGGPGGPGFGGSRPEGIPKSLLDAVREVPGVAAAAGGVNGVVQLFELDGTPVAPQGPRGGPPTFGTTIAEKEGLSVFATRAGRFPRGAGELAIDFESADRLGWKAGKKIKVAARGVAHEFKVVGVFGVQGLNTLGGATFVVFEIETAQKIFERPDSFDAISIKADPDVSSATLAERVKAKVGDDYQVVAQESFVGDLSTQIRRGLSFLTNALLTFAFVALFVGAFLIFNTFSILFAQRVREFAMLRAIGAQRSQILRIVIAEAAIIGAVASTMGIGVGIATALGLQKFLQATGARLPTGGLDVRPRTIIVALIVGTTVTLLAAIVPALRATRVPPVAAIREGSVLPKARFSPTRNLLSLILGSLGVGLLAWGLFGDPPGRLGVLGGGAISVFLAVALISPLLARPISLLIGWPINRIAGVTGKIAQGNAIRDPNRTAATAAALMIGVALISFITIFASSIRESTSQALERSVKADFIALSQQTPIHPTMAVRLRSLPEVDLAVPMRLAFLQIGTGTARIGGTDPLAFSQVVALEVQQGDLSDLVEGGVFANVEFADDRKLKSGDEVEVKFPREEVEKLEIEGIFGEGASTNLLMSLDGFTRHYPDARDSMVYVKLAPGISEGRGRAAIEGVAKDFPGVELMNLEQLKQEQGGNIDRALTLINALLGLALVIAIFGIVNTLALSVIERVREIGLMRAVGVTRRQVRAIVRWESVIISVMGATLGVAVGVFFGWLLVTSLADEGLQDFVVPGGRLALYVVLAAVAGVLAAVLPARGAARVDVLRAIAFE